MSFLLNRRIDDFARELNFDQLLAVNGGCGGSFSGDSGYTGGSGENHGYNSYGSGGSGSSSSGSGSCNGSGSYSGGSSSSGSGSCSGSGSYSGGSSSSGSGSCSGTGSYNSGSSSSSSSGTCSGTTSSLTHQTPDDPNDFHCDIIAYNEAIDHGIQAPGSWDGNHDNVETIYENNYAGKGSDTAQSNTSGYVFYDCDSNGTYEHMEYYSAGAGNKYTCWTTDGITNPVPVAYDSTVDSNGHAMTGKATFVNLN